MNFDLCFILDAAAAASTVDTSARLKIKWNAKKHDPDNGGYSEEKLQLYLQKVRERISKL